MRRQLGELGLIDAQAVADSRYFRMAAEDDIAALVGDDAQAALAEEMWESRRESFRNHQDG